MINPLDEQIESCRTAMSAFKVVRRVLDERTNPTSNTDFYGLTKQEGHDMLDRAEEQLNKLVAFSLFAAFERTLRDHLAKNLKPNQTSSKTPTELGDKLHDFLEGGVDNWIIDSVIELFQPPAAEQDINNAKNIRTYRNRVAHGSSPSVAIPPRTAHNQLSDFLKNVGLVS